MTWIKKFISESFAWLGGGYLTVKGVGSRWLSENIESSTKIRRFSFRLKAIWR